MHRPLVSAKVAPEKLAMAINTILQTFVLNFACSFAHRGGSSLQDTTKVQTWDKWRVRYHTNDETLIKTWSLMTRVEDDQSSPKLNSGPFFAE